MIGQMGLMGLGVVLPPAVDVVQHVLAAGGDPTGYTGWMNARHAGADEHPSSLGEEALIRALSASGIGAEDLALVLYCGTSRDYPASWSVSTEIMAHCGVGDEAIGIDTMAGCLAALASIEFAGGWLRSRGTGYAAVIAAERWTQTVDFSDRSAIGLWPHADGASASIWGMEVSTRPLLNFVGSEFCNAAENNNYLRVAYGGTRAPVAPPGVSPNLRVVRETPLGYIRDLYRDGYRKSFSMLKNRFDLNPTHLVCNQTSPGTVAWVANEYGLSDSVSITGHENGHMGGSDIFVGLDRLLNGGGRYDTVLLAASAPYGFGAGFMVRP